MVKKKVVILGGGISGLLAAWALRRKQVDITIIERGGELGGNWAAGGLKYTKPTDSFCELLACAGIDQKIKHVKGRLHWDCYPQPHPEWLRSADPATQMYAKVLHWTKTRGWSAPAEMTTLNDFAGSRKPEMALDYNQGHLMSWLVSEVAGRSFVATKADVSVITDETVEIATGEFFQYDMLISTIPLPVLVGLSPWWQWPALPEPKKLNIVIFELQHPPSFYGIDWTYMYTPQSNHCSRISVYQSQAGQTELHVEIPETCLSEFARGQLGAEVSRLTGAFTLNLQPKAVRSIPGHIQMSADIVPWPRLKLLGRYAEWNSRLVATDVLESAKKLAEAFI